MLMGMLLSMAKEGGVVVVVVVSPQAFVYAWQIPERPTSCLDMSHFTTDASSS
jgi:hypothetical protein